MGWLQQHFRSFSHSPGNCGDALKPKTPLKFNSSWLKYEKFHQIIKDTWITFSQDGDKIPVEVIVNNLTRLKHRRIVWAKEKQNMEEENLWKIKVDLANLVDSDNNGFISPKAKMKLTQL